MDKIGGALTGDSTNLTMYIVIAALAIIFLFIVIFIKRKKK